MQRRVRRCRGRRVFNRGRRGAMVLGALFGACVHHAPSTVTEAGPVGRVVTPEAVNASDVYRRAGFISATGEIPFVGAVRYLAGGDDNAVLAIVVLSFPNRR